MQELVSTLVKKYPKEIISFVLFGSATTGEWIHGKSDIDCIVIIKNKQLCEEIEMFLHQLLLDLDSIYRLNLAQTCTSHKKTDNLLLNLIIKTENKMMFGQPFYVVAENQLNIKKFKISKDLKSQLASKTIVSFGLFLQRIKCTGIILYGKDIREQIPDKIPEIEKLKASFNAMLLLMMSYVIYPYSQKTAFSHAVKANFWACNDVLFALDQKLSTSKEEIGQIYSIFGAKEINFDHLMLSLKYKKIEDEIKITRLFVLAYMFKSTKFVYGLYGSALRKILGL